MITIEKTAGQIIDQQDDPGFVFESLAELWPAGLEPPSVGVERTSGLVKVANDHGEQRWAYPVETASDVLASSMYCEMFGPDVFGAEEFTKIAEELALYRLMFDVELPDGLRPMDKVAQPIEVYADDHDHLPVTTPEQFEASERAFVKNAHLWSCDQRWAIEHNLKQAADFHGMPCQVDGYTHLDPDRLARGVAARKQWAMDKRAGLVRANGMQDDPEFFYLSEYCDELDELADSGEPVHVKIASLEQLDRDVEVERFWGQGIPDPVATVVGPTPLSKYASCNYDKLRGVLDDDVVDAIAQDPDVVIPTLPMETRAMVEELLDV